MEEKSALTGAVWPATQMMVCPLLIERARKEAERPDVLVPAYECPDADHPFTFTPIIRKKLVLLNTTSTKQEHFGTRLWRACGCACVRVWPSWQPPGTGC